MEEAVSEVDLEGEDLGDDILNMTENDGGHSMRISC